MTSRPEPICLGCNRAPEQIAEYVDAASPENYGRPITPSEYVRREEGTYNPNNGHFLCTDCYCAAGMPSSPSGWLAP